MVARGKLPVLVAITKTTQGYEAKLTIAVAG
jgi:hypothetical protein